MSNADFYSTFFPATFWSDMDTRFLEEDQHSMFGDADVLKWLIEKIQPQNIVEIGSWKGHSANYMIDVSKSIGLETPVICIDTFMGAGEHWLLPGSIETLKRRNEQPRIHDNFLANTIARGNAGHVCPLTVDSVAGAEILKHFDFKADLIFIDAGHSYDDVQRDIMSYFPRLSTSGIMFGDDYQWEPLATAVHDCANKLGVQVLVSARKWIFLNDALAQRVIREGIQIRTSFQGWSHG